MGFLDFIDRDKLVCTFCGKKPVVGFACTVDATISAEGVTRELVESSVVAACKGCLPILQERFEKEVRDSDFVGEVDGDG